MRSQYRHKFTGNSENQATCGTENAWQGCKVLFRFGNSCLLCYFQTRDINVTWEPRGTNVGFQKPCNPSGRNCSVRCGQTFLKWLTNGRCYLLVWVAYTTSTHFSTTSVSMRAAFWRGCTAHNSKPASAVISMSSSESSTSNSSAGSSGG